MSCFLPNTDYNITKADPLYGIKLYTLYRTINKSPLQNWNASMVYKILAYSITKLIAVQKNAKYIRILMFITLYNTKSNHVFIDPDKILPWI